MRLLERHSRGVTLTKAGSIFHRHALTILETIERAKSALFPFQSGQRTDVLIGVTPNTARHIVPELLEACIRSASPAIRIMIQQGHSAEMLEEVEGRSLDMAFCYGRRALTASAFFRFMVRTSFFLGRAIWSAKETISSSAICPDFR